MLWEVGCLQGVVGEMGLLEERVWGDGIGCGENECGCLTYCIKGRDIDC